MMPWGLPNRPHGGEWTAILTTERSSSRKKKDVVDIFIPAGYFYICLFPRENLLKTNMKQFFLRCAIICGAVVNEESLFGQKKQYEVVALSSGKLGK